MRISSALAVLVVCAIAGTGGAHAQTSMGDPKRGQALAERVCSTCHIVSAASTTTTNPDVPTFAAIAGRPDTTPERLAGRIIIPHPPMPNIQLTVAEMRDIIAYIVSLKPRR